MSRGVKKVKIIEVTIYVEPTAKGRPRVTMIGGHAHAYTPAKTRKAQNMIQAYIRNELKDNFQAFEDDVPLHVSAVFFRERPKSIPKRITQPVSRPDIINYLSTLFDALNKYVYNDDSQIVSINSQKKFGSPPRIELMIREDLE